MPAADHDRKLYRALMGGAGLSPACDAGDHALPVTLNPGLIQQELLSAFRVPGERVIEHLLNRRRIGAGFHRINRLAISDRELAALDVQSAGIEPVQRVSQFQAQTDGAERFAINESKSDAFDDPAFEDRIGGCETRWRETNTGDGAPVQELRKLLAMDPIRADLLKGSVRPSAD